MQNAAIDQRVQFFIETCRASPFENYPQRVAIFRLLIRSKQHPTADLVFRAVKKEFPNISFDTVNRTLSTFADIGVVDVVETFGGPKRFDPDISNHHHLHCVACGRIIDFETPVMPAWTCRKAIAGRFKVISRRVILKGLCETCTQNSWNSCFQTFF
jgi:Fur family peroxide stress response transcriptional regulator